MVNVGERHERGCVTTAGRLCRVVTRRTWTS